MKALLSAYGAFFMVEGFTVNLLLLTSTLLIPTTGLAGIAVGGLALAWRRLLGLRPVGANLEIINSVLVGLLLGATFQPCGPALILLLAAAPIAVTVTHLWADGARLPVLCAPFVVTSYFLLEAGKSLWLPLAPGEAAVAISPDGLGWLKALGAIYFNPSPVGGGLMMLALLRGSGYLALLAGLGYLASELTLTSLGLPPGSPARLWAGSEAALTTLMVGGLFTAPSLRSALVATVAGAWATLLYIGLAQALWPLGLYPLALPFLLATWSTMRLLSPLRSPRWSHFWLTTPALPQHSAETTQISRVRGVSPDSLALRLPFGGTWEVYQGWDGLHTHQGLWAYGVDFIQTRDGLSFAGRGEQLEDYYCFGAAIISPVHAVVAEARHDLPDNSPGGVELENRWGNYLLLDLSNGDFVLLAHLQRGSLQVEIGQTVWPGQQLARCGNSGRSPQPHLHLHLQTGRALGSPTRPFHFTQLLCHDELRLDYRPLEAGHKLQPAPLNPALAQALNLPVGCRLRYSLEDGRQAEFTVCLDLGGQFWLESSSQARVAFVQTPDLLAFYGRRGPADPVLDAFLLAMGLTPKADGALRYRDAAPSRLLPAYSLARLMARLQPWSACCRSEYTRTWDGSAQLWVQRGCHYVGSFSIVSEARLSEASPPLSFELQLDGQVLVRAHLLSQAMRADRGVPGWERMALCCP